MPTILRCALDLWVVPVAGFLRDCTASSMKSRGYLYPFLPSSRGRLLLSRGVRAKKIRIRLTALGGAATLCQSARRHEITFSSVLYGLVCAFHCLGATPDPHKITHKIKSFIQEQELSCKFNVFAYFSRG